MPRQGYLQKFYFTYGTDPGQPFCGGWSLIYAPSIQAACAIFKAYHPNESAPDILNCSWYYSAEQFEQTEMLYDGNFGAFCHEVIGPFPAEAPMRKPHPAYSVDGEVYK